MGIKVYSGYERTNISEESTDLYTRTTVDIKETFEVPHSPDNPNSLDQPPENVEVKVQRKKF